MAILHIPDGLKNHRIKHQTSIIPASRRDDDGRCIIAFYGIHVIDVVRRQFASEMEQGIGIDSVHVNDVALDVARSDAIGTGQDALQGVPLQIQFQGRRNGDRRQINLSIFAQRPFRQFISVYDQS